MTRFSRIVPAAICGLSLMACGNPNFARAVKAAREAEARGDVATAAEQWTLACRIDPTDNDACAKAKGTATTLREQSVARAKPQCEAAATYDACLNTLAQSRGLFPDDPDMNALVDGGAALYVKYCQEKEHVDTLQGITDVVECLEKVKPKVARPAYDSLVTQQRKRAAVLCSRNFDASSLASAHAYRSAARCLDSSSVPQSDVDAAANRWMAKRRVVLKTGLSGGGLTDSSSVCNAIARGLGPFASCSAPVGVLTVPVSVASRLDESRHTIREELKDATYVAGYTQQPNPAYAGAERRVMDTRMASRDADTQLARCQRSGRRCTNLMELDYQARSRRSDYESALSDLRRTDTTITVPVHETVSYTVKYHNWVVPWSYTIDLLGGASASNSGEANYDGVESPAIAKAGVQAQVLHTPTRSTFERILFDAAVPAAVNLVRNRVLEQTACSENDGECKVTRVVYTTGRIPGPKDYIGAIPCDGDAQ